MADASCKRTKISAEMLNMYKQRSMVSLFSMSGTDPAMRRRLMNLLQMRAINQLGEKENSDNPNRARE